MFKGLLDTHDSHSPKLKLFAAFAAEFVVNIIFSCYGQSAATALKGRTTDPVIVLAFCNSMSLTVAIFISANVSGGHVTPSVTIATWITGYTSAVRSIGYMISQLCGCIVGNLLMDGLIHPITSPGDGTGCVVSTDINHGQLFGWETFISFVLVVTVFAVAVGEPSFGNIAPLAVGLTVFIGVLAEGTYTGGGFSPARVLGNAIVHQCNWGQVYIYVIGEMLGGVIAGVISWPLYGSGRDFLAIFDRPHAPPDAPLANDKTPFKDDSVRLGEAGDGYVTDHGRKGVGYLDKEHVRTGEGYLTTEPQVDKDGRALPGARGYLNEHV